MENTKFIAKYAFYPLIHTVIKERKYKKGDPAKQVIINNKIRAHKFKNIKTGKTAQTVKNRPLHYATHFDSIIYAYYAFLLQNEYETKIKAIDGLPDCITAYRKLKIDPKLDDNVKGNGKSTIHFAKEIFNEISDRATLEDISVLTFDIKSFFSSLNHQKLKRVWEEIMDFSSGLESNPDHANVFKATTKFNYILLDDLRISKAKGKKEGFDEKKLDYIRKTKGFKSFFESNAEFRNAIKSGRLKVYSNPFKQKGGILMGIPQGLPISAILANMYLFDFDKAILNELVNNNDCYYRRYSDDIILICNSSKVNLVQDVVEKQMALAQVEISKDKTEIFDFRFEFYNKHNDKRLTSFKYDRQNNIKKHAPLVYLGFEYRGYNTLVKSANISKFYRRMITIIKRRARRSERLVNTNPNAKHAIFLNQIKKIYKLKPKARHYKNVDKEPKVKKRKFLKENERGDFYFNESKVNPKKKMNSNYFSYLRRASDIMENESIKRQLRKSKHILWNTINKYLKK